MPPAAATAAARRITAQPAPGRTAAAAAGAAPRRAATTATATAPAAAPSAPRRASRVAAPARPVPQRPRTAPARPRTAPHTNPAPARRPRTAAPAPRPIRTERPAPRSLRVDHRPARLGLISRLPSGGKLLDSIVRGRAWIPVLGVLLVGIVGMRVEVLKLGSSVGAEMQQAAQLQSANAVMQSQVSTLSDNQRIEQLAARRGMVMPGPLDQHFVNASSPVNVNKAIADIREPSPATFLSSLVSERAKDEASATAAADTSAVGVLGGGSIDSGSTGTVTSPGSDQATTTPAVSSSNTDATGATEAPDATGTDTPATGTTAAASDTGTAGGATDSSPPPTDAGTNGAASLAG